MPLTERQDRRAHTRYQSTLETDISVYADGQLELVESTRIRDISGGGAQFVSSRIEYYSIGQSLQLCIHLPGTHGEGQTIECAAHVVWINDQGEPLESSISITMNYMFDPAQIKSLAIHSGHSEISE
ncbi:MAG: PilZ domain-containing protein [Mariprofundaceae bacterium]|nr:PilZ domain-containing protein [Mariprofundaceae bacterium]